MRITRCGLGFTLAALLAACGGGGGDDSAVSANPAPSPAAPAPAAPPAAPVAAPAPSSADFAFTASAANALTAYTEAVAAGGDARAASPRPASACLAVTPANAASFRTTVASFEDLISRTRGTPCVFDPLTVVNAANQVLSPGAQNDWWSNSTQTVAITGTAPLSTTASATSYYTTNTLRSMAFPAGAGNTVAYLNCRQRYDGSSRNCTPAGTGSYTIGPLSDGGRVLTLVGLPATWGVTATVVLIEQGGQVYGGTKR